ncbi:N-acetyltransferase [bacterium]|nr:MAG: N-acetyltransferase [bacterium]
MQPITTERLIVRPFAASDLADFLAYQSLPEVRMYMGGEPMSEEKAAKFIGQMAVAQGNEKGQYHAFAVYHPSDERVIGDVGFYLEEGPEEKGDLGFQFHPAYHGKGYAHEAASALMGYGFLQLNLRRITSGCDARNTASFQLMERLGLRREAHFVQSRITNGVLHNEYAYALLRDEWLARQA